MTADHHTDDMDPSGRVPRFRDSFLTRVYAEILCFFLIFRFHDNNNHLRKAVTLMVVFVWGTLELSVALGLGTVPDSMSWLRLFVGILIARMWNIELTSFAENVTKVSDGGTDGGDEHEEHE